MFHVYEQRLGGCTLAEPVKGGREVRQAFASPPALPFEPLPREVVARRG